MSQMLDKIRQDAALARAAAIKFRAPQASFGGIEAPKSWLGSAEGRFTLLVLVPALVVIGIPAIMVWHLTRGNWGKR